MNGIIDVQKLTDETLAQEACSFTLHSQSNTGITLATLYAMGHSPIRTQIFQVRMWHIPNFVSVHFVRHNVGVTHFVQTNRIDRGATETANRMTPTNHMMICNAETLINMARKRLCCKASMETRAVMQKIVDEIKSVDPALYQHLVPECIYRGRICHEAKMCGKMRGVVHYLRGGDMIAWKRTADELPPCGKKVIAHYINEIGKHRTVMAHYIPPLTVKCCDFYDPDSEYDEDFKDGEDEGYVKESWHELIENWDEYSGCEIVDAVTHWMPCPDYPEAEE